MRHLQLAFVTAIAALAAAPAAHALTVVRAGNTIQIDAPAGEANQVIVSDAGGMLRVTEGNNGNGATINPGGGCANSVANSVDCGGAATVTDLVANLGDLDDQFGSGLAFPLTVDGGGGNDNLAGSVGNDTLAGGAGNDSIEAAPGQDTVDGGIGNDSLYGDLGDDTVLGGEGNDSLNDSDGTNTLDGGDGDDFFEGGTGVDQLRGGPGRDTMLGEGEVAGADVVDGGAGIDSAFAYSEGAPLDISLDDAANDGAVGQGANFLSVEEVGGGSADDKIVGSPANEYLSGDAGVDVIDGLGGNDELNGGSQNDALFGSDGNDDLYGQSGDDSLSGGNGSDMVYGGDGADDLSGGAGRDLANFGNGSAYTGVTVTLDDQPNDGTGGEGDNAHSDNENIYGSGGPDLLVGGPGVNTIMGGYGDDVIVTADGAPGVATRDQALCGEGEDTVQADPLDFIGEKEELCESVQFASLAGFGPALGVVAFGRGVGVENALPLELTCPLDARGGCDGRVRLTVGGKKGGQVRFSLEAGEIAERVLHFSRSVRRALARRARVKGNLQISVADEIGATRTGTKSVTLRR